MLANPPSHPPKARLFDFIDDVFQRYQMMNAGGIIHSLNPQPCLPGAQLTDRLDRIHTDLLQLPRYRLTDVGQLCQFSHLLLMTRLGAEFWQRKRSGWWHHRCWGLIHSAPFIRLYQKTAAILYLDCGCYCGMTQEMIQSTAVIVHWRFRFTLGAIGCRNQFLGA